MDSFLRQSTTITRRIGPFLDATDGVTPETGLAGSMTVYLSKAGGAYAARNSATAIAYDRDGFYNVELNTTDSNTVGELRYEVTSAATHLPVWGSFQVLEEPVYDALIAGSSNLSTAVASITAGAITAAAFAAAANEAIADAYLARNVAGGSNTGRLVKEAMQSLRNKVVFSGGTMTVYGTDDTTVLFTATYTVDGNGNVVSIDPA